MNMEIELPTDDVTEVEFEYIKIEKHCFTCFSLFHEESDCIHRPLNAPPPKDLKLGITQSIALQRIEAEKRRHDDMRGYRRTDVPRPPTSAPGASYPQAGRDRSYDMRHQPREGDYRIDHSILSRTAHSNSGYRRMEALNMQYRVVEKSRLSSGSSPPISIHHLANREERLRETPNHVKPKATHWMISVWTLHLLVTWETD